MAEYDEPEFEAPVAVVRRRGETPGQLDLRQEGFSDAQTGYTGRGGRGALARSYQRSRDMQTQQRFEERESGTRDRFDQTHDLAERKYMLDERQFAAQERMQKSAQADKKAAIDQMSAFLDEEDALAAKFGRNSDEFLLGTLSASKKYSAALADPVFGQRLASKLTHYDKLIGEGPTREKKLALWEIGQFDPSAADMTPAQKRQYLGTFAGKYPGASNDKALVDALAAKAQQVDLLESRSTEVPADLEPSSATRGPDGKVSVTSTRTKEDTENLGTERIDEEGKISITRPLTPERQREIEAGKERARIEARHNELQVLVNNGKVKDFTEINAVKRQLGYQEIGPDGKVLPVTAAPAPAVDRKTRAQQALDDPEATPEEKAAAKRILGQ